MFQITLHDTRILSGFSLEDVAIACEVTVDEIKKYEQDTRKIPFDIAKRIKRLSGYFALILSGFLSAWSRNIIKKTCLKRAQRACNAPRK